MGKQSERALSSNPHIITTRAQTNWTNNHPHRATLSPYHALFLGYSLSLSVRLSFTRHSGSLFCLWMPCALGCSIAGSSRNPFWGHRTFLPHVVRVCRKPWQLIRNFYIGFAQGCTLKACRGHWRNLRVCVCVCASLCFYSVLNICFSLPRPYHLSQKANAWVGRLVMGCWVGNHVGTCGSWGVCNGPETTADAKACTLLTSEKLAKRKWKNIQTQVRQ